MDPHAVEHDRQRSADDLAYSIVWKDVATHCICEASIAESGMRTCAFHWCSALVRFACPIASGTARVVSAGSAPTFLHAASTTGAGCDLTSIASIWQQELRLLLAEDEGDADLAAPDARSSCNRCNKEPERAVSRMMPHAVGDVAWRPCDAERIRADKRLRKVARYLEKIELTMRRSQDALHHKCPTVPAGGFAPSVTVSRSCRW